MRYVPGRLRSFVGLKVIRTATAKDQYRDHLISMRKHREKREDDAGQRLWVEDFECTFL